MGLVKSSGHLKAFTVVALAAIVIFGAFLYWQDRSASAPSTDVRQAPPLAGIEVTDLNSVKHVLADRGGKILIINFWASWCAPCVEEIPSLVKLSKELPGRIEIIAISGDTNVDEINIFLKSFPEFKGNNIHVVWDEKLRHSKTFGVARLPESFIYDGKGNFVRKVVGSIPWATPDAIAFMKSL